MAYRDELEAAHARIEALETRLAEAGGVSDAARAALARTEEAERRLGELMASTAALTAKHEALVAALRAAPAALPTLTEHSRRTPPGENALSGSAAGVACPLCLLVCGDRVEMREGGNLQLVVRQSGVLGPAGNTVRCPRCDYLAIKI